MSATKQPKFIVEITDEFDTIRFLKKYVTTKRIEITDQLCLAKKGFRSQMVPRARLLRLQGYKAWARPIEVSS